MSRRRIRPRVHKPRDDDAAISASAVEFAAVWNGSDVGRPFVIAAFVQAHGDFPSTNAAIHSAIRNRLRTINRAALRALHDNP